MLYVDDEAAIRRAAHAWLARDGVKVHSARSALGARRCMAMHHFDGAFIDLWLGESSGLELYDWMLANRPLLAERTVFVTGDTLASAETMTRLAQTGRAVIAKPFDLAELSHYARAWSDRPRRNGFDAGAELSPSP